MQQNSRSEIEPTLCPMQQQCNLPLKDSYLKQSVTSDKFEIESWQCRLQKRHSDTSGRMSSAPIPYSCNFASVAALPPSDVGYKSIPVYVVYLNLQYSMRYVVCVSKTWELFESVVLELAQSHHNLELKRQDGWAEKGLQSMPTACKGISRSTFLFWPTTRFHITSHSLR